MTAAERVLVVDDEPNVRLVFRTALAAEGYEVVEAADGAEALARLAAVRVGIALLDLRMPELDGLATLRRLREAGDDTPVVIVTAHGSIPDAVEAMRLGAIDFLSKPVTPDQLRRVVADVLARHAEAAPAAPAEAPARGPTVVTVGPSVLDLSRAKLALNRREFDTAARLLDEALADAPDSAEALTLKGVLLETQGQNHAAYHSYREALDINPNYPPALDNLKRYCLRNGLDADNPRINPAAGRAHH